MAERARRMAPRRLSFNLDDFPETDGGGIDLNTMIGGERLNDGLGEEHFVTPIINPMGRREELNLLGGFETPEVTVTKNDAQAMILVDVLNNLIASQQSLVNLVTGLKTQTKEEEVSHEEQRVQKHIEHSLGPQDDAPVTQGELRRLLQVGKNSPSLTFDLEPPLIEEILVIPYPVGYQSPSFRKFDGTGSAREHLMCFMDDLGVHRNNKELSLKEFSKDRTLQCKETLPEADLVYGCIKNIEDGSQIFLSLGGISTFAELIKKGTNVAEAMKRQGKRTKEAEGTYDICALEDRDRKRSFRGNQNAKRFIPQDVEDLPPLPINRQQACRLIEEWLKDGTIQPKVNRPPLPKEQYDDPSFCILHRTRAHTTTDYWTVRRTFQRQVRAGKVLLPEKEKVDRDLHRRPLPNHGVNVISSAQREIRIEEMEEESDVEVNALTIGLAKTRSFRILFSQLGLNHDAQ
ncbi:hypothetical protein SESBI_31662 [Sesbania bispinosa]|nr:hypothetical protein SESBI_31662 [Sesbania bispinosa]